LQLVLLMANNMCLLRKIAAESRMNYNYSSDALSRYMKCPISCRRFIKLFLSFSKKGIVKASLDLTVNDLRQERG
jgi:hypothetical protein